MDAVWNAVARADRTAGPLLTYLPQLYLLRRTSKDGFAPATCLSELLGRSLDFGAWGNGAGPRDASAPAGAALGALGQLLLLDAVVQAKRKKGDIAGSPAAARRARYGATTRQLGREVRAVARAALARDWARALELARAMQASFWAWDELAPYVEVVVVFSLWLAALSALLRRAAWFGALLARGAAAVDACVAVPQLWRTARRRDAAGVAAATVALRGLRALAAGGALAAARAAADALVLAQMAAHGAPGARCAAALAPLRARAARCRAALPAWGRRGKPRGEARDSKPPGSPAGAGAEARADGGPGSPGGARDEDPLLAGDAP